MNAMTTTQSHKHWPTISFQYSVFHPHKSLDLFYPGIYINPPDQRFRAGGSGSLLALGAGGVSPGPLVTVTSCGSPSRPPTNKIQKKKGLGFRD